MATNCSKCGAALPEGAGRCPSCLAIVKPPGFWQRLFGGFKVNLSVKTGVEPPAKSGVHFTTSVKQTFKIRDAATGEVKEYHSLDEIPAQYRVKIAQAMANGPSPVAKTSAITFTGADGVTRTYRSMAEVPPDIRALIERAQQSGDVFGRG